MNRLHLNSSGKLLSGALAVAVLLSGATFALASDTTVKLSDTVTTALEYSPRLKVLNANNEAISHERDRAFGSYYPSVDLAFGYGAEAHSDTFTRAKNEEHNWEDRLEASIQMTQLLYDGNETGSRVAIEDAKLDSARLRVLDNAEAIALDAVIAHMEVIQQKELVALAQKNVTDHQDIVGRLDERQRAGAGSIADLSQAQGRLSRAQATLAETQSKLRSAEANYMRVVGKLAGDLEFYVVPANLVPKTLNDALHATAAHNPKVRALSFNVNEAQERVNLSKSSNLPKINLELSSSYEDNVESLETYEHNNQAMVRARWNIFNGGSDVADRKAAVARKMQTIAQKDDQADLVIEETRATWAELQSARARALSFGDAVTYNQKTLEAYMQQFDVGQRTLLDVLDARNELFQSSGQLITAKVNEIVAAERLLALGGKLNQTLQIEETLYTAKQ